MTYNDLVQNLASAGCSEPNSEALMILEHLFKATHSDVLIYPERDYPDSVIKPILTRRFTGEPIQYIIGRVFFCGTVIKVNENCLIPRSDTEILCEHLTEHLPENGHFLELCTGSGCIPIAVLQKRNDLTCDAYELVPETAELARENRKLNKIDENRLLIYTGDALNISTNERTCLYDAIVSNPPYIPSEVVPTLSIEVQHEPAIALDGGADGLLFYRKFLTSYAPMLKQNGFFAFEIGYDQAHGITNMCTELGYRIQIIKDYSRNDRVAVIHPN